MRLIFSVACFFLTVLCFPQTCAYWYCEEAEQELCKGEKHIGCNKGEDISMDDATLSALYPMTNKLVNLFLDAHNNRRDALASGEETCADGCTFPKASRMRELIWNHELAYLARLHVSRCSDEKDKCHNTKQFPECGQNTNLRISYKKEDPLEGIEYAISFWHRQKVNVTDGDALQANYTGDEDSSTWEPFSLLINDRASQIGCSLAFCNRTDSETLKDEYRYFVTCNYDAALVKGEPVYMSDGEAASKCSDWHAGLSEDFESLCENTAERPTIIYTKPNATTSTTTTTAAPNEGPDTDKPPAEKPVPIK